MEETTNVLEKYKKKPYKKRLSIAGAIQRSLNKMAKEGSWIQGGKAMNADGDWVEPDSDDAVKFCAIGALANQAGPLFDDARMVVNASIKSEIHDTYCGGDGSTGTCDCMIEVNDSIGKRAVTSLFKRAIKNLDVKQEDVNKIAHN